MTMDFEEETLYFESELTAGNEAILDGFSSPSVEGGRATDLAIDGQFKKGTRDPNLIYNPWEIRFTGVMDSSTMEVTSGGQLATLLFSFGDPAFFMSQHPANPNPGARDPFLLKIPFEVWDVERNVQLNVSFTDNAQKIAEIDSGTFVPTWAPRGNCVVYVVASEYDEQIHNNSFTGQDTMATWTFQFTPEAVWQTGDIIKINIADPDTFPKPVVPGVEEFSFSLQGETRDLSNAKAKLDIINVYPNPYLAHNLLETQLHEEHVTFINLPEECTIRIFSIAGQLIRTIEHTDATSLTHDWNLRNENNLPVASGLYIAHIDIPDVGEKILKMAVVFRKQRLKNL
jgi:hypothetical protein